MSKKGNVRTPERMLNLHVEYDRVRSDYSKIKKEYVRQREAYFVINRKARESSWLKHWKAYLEEEFQGLKFSQIDLERIPAELAYIHLGKQLGYNPGTVERKVRETRRLDAEREKRKTSANF